MAETKAQIVISADDRASRILKGLNDTVSGVVASFARLSAGGAALGAGVLVAGIRNMVSAVDDLDEAAQGLGTTAVELSNLRRAAIESGVGAEKLDTALTKLNVRLTDAAGGGEQSVRLFETLGIAVRDAGGNVRGTGEVLRDVAAKFQSFRDGPEKAALAVELFGKAGAKLIAFLNQGAAGLEKFSGLTDETVAGAKKLQLEIDSLSASWEQLKFAILGGALPAINTAIERFKQIDVGRAASKILPMLIIRDLALQGEEIRAREGVALAIANTNAVRRSEIDMLKQAAPVVEQEVKAKEKLARVQNEVTFSYAEDFKVLARIREERAKFNDELEREAELRAKRVEDLTGRTKAAQAVADIELVTKALEEGRISIIEYDLAYSEIYGRDTTDKIKEVRSLTEDLGLTIASSVGEFITTGGSVSNFFRAIEQDVIKLITQMLVLKPLADYIGKSLKGLTSGEGSFDFGGILGELFSGAFADGGFIKPGSFGIVGERGPELVTGGRSGATVAPMSGGGNTININVQGGTTPATANQIALAVSRQLAISHARFG